MSAQKSLSWSRARTIDVSAAPHRSRDSFPYGALHPSGLSARYARRVRHSNEWNECLCEPFVFRPVLFQQVRKYGCPVWQCRAEPVCEYLDRVISCIEEELEKVRISVEHTPFEERRKDLSGPLAQGSIRRVMLVVREATPEATPLERFVFDLEWYIKQQDMPKDGPDFV